MLENANTNLAAARGLINQIFERDSAEELSTRAERIQEWIAELKRLVKQ